MSRTAGTRASRAVLASILVLHGCREAVSPGATSAPGQPWFEEVAAPSGLDYEFRSGHQELCYIPEITAGGVALIDADEDGYLDVYFVQGGPLTAPPAERPGNQLFRNRADGTFEDRSAGSGADDRGYGVGVATGDSDEDGHVDLYVTNVGPNVLLRGSGAATFQDVTQAAGVGDPGFGSSAAFLDFDRDGDLDLFVANYLVWSPDKERDCFNSLGQRDYCAPATYNAPALAVLYRNEGAGSFTEVSAETGIASTPSTGLGVVCGDFTGDGSSDVFVANDGRVNHLWVNLGGGRFEDQALLLGCAMDQDGFAKAGMGVDAADFDDDGDLDLLVGNLRGESDSLFRNDGAYFSDVSALAGLGTISRPFTRFGLGWADFDNDGRLDLYQANGRVAGQGEGDPFAEPNLLYRGIGSGRFEELLPRGGTASLLVHTSRGAAFGDLDNDGGIDVVVVNRDAPAYLLRNRVERGDWLLVRVLDEDGRDALGAVLTLRCRDRTLRREVRTAYSYCSASDPRVHFGLGRGGRVDSIDVRWPGGESERYPIPGLNRVLEIQRRPPPGPR